MIDNQSIDTSVREKLYTATSVGKQKQRTRPWNRRVGAPSPDQSRPTPDPRNTKIHTRDVSIGVRGKSLRNHWNMSTRRGRSRLCVSALHVLMFLKFPEDFCAQLLIPSPCCGCGLPLLVDDTNVCVLGCTRSAIRYTKFVCHDVKVSASGSGCPLGQQETQEALIRGTWHVESQRENSSSQRVERK